MGGFIPKYRMAVLMVASITKRAQLPFSAWLPAAMAAPTPVSSLVHSSTLVTAGVYVLVRLNISVCYSAELSVLFILASITIILASRGALKERDSKKIVALSTLRQLGLIILILNLIIPGLVFNHLITHAYFKALLFIAVGNMIHISQGYQDLRRQGNPPIMGPVTFYSALIANFSLIGLPFLSGFYSKDFLLEHRVNMSVNIYMVIVFFFGVRLTLLYSVRFSVLLFRQKHSPSLINKIEKDRLMALPLLIIVPLAGFSGAVSSRFVSDIPTVTLVNQDFKVGLLLVIFTCLILPIIDLSRPQNVGPVDRGFNM